MAKNKLKVIDLFCGVGGLSYGFAHNTNFQIIAANEILPNMGQAYALNHRDVKVYLNDIKDFGASVIEKDLGIQKDEVSIIVGGPPCQAYSTVGKRLLDDPRSSLFQEYYRNLKEFNPSLFLFENVRGLVSMQNGDLLKTIISQFSSLGYKVEYKILNAADYGVPQIRERVIIVGSKLKKDFKYPKPTHHSPKESPNLCVNNSNTWLTLEDAISDLPFIKSGEESVSYSSKPQNDYQTLMRQNASNKLADHNAPKNNPNLVRLMENLPDGGSPEDLPIELRPKSGFKNTYCRLWWKKPCTTVTRNFSTPSSSRCIHPKAARPLTTREGARIQSFPDEYVFCGSRSDKNLQIGNAVPPLLAMALTESIIDVFER